MPTPAEIDPTLLQREIAQVETEATRVELERVRHAQAVARLKRTIRRLKIARFIRQPLGSVPAYPLWMCAVVPLLVGAATFILADLLTGSRLLSFLAFLVSSGVSLATLGYLLFVPPTELLAPQLAEAEGKLAVETPQLQASLQSLAELNQRLAALHEQRRSLAKGEKLQRAMLLQRNWKTLRGIEWEDYVVEVCRTLGANVQRGDTRETISPTPATGPRGVIRSTSNTLFVTFSPRRVAVAALADINPFHAAAVRQVIDHLAQQGCDELAIITNARITAGSKEYARSRHCALIGEEEFPDFVLGRVSL